MCFKQLLPNMASQLVNQRGSNKHCPGVYEKNSIVNGVHVDDWTTEWAIIAKMGMLQPVDNYTTSFIEDFRKGIHEEFLPNFDR